MGGLEFAKFFTALWGKDTEQFDEKKAVTVASVAVADSLQSVRSFARQEDAHVNAE